MRPNVLLVVLDCVRARNTSLLGYRRETTPALTGFAETATTYTQARTSATWSLPAHASLFTGVPAAGHRLGVTDALDPGQTVFDYLADEGYDTGVFTENPYLTVHPSNLGAAFETVVTERPDSTDVADPEETRNAVDGVWYADRLLDWTAAREGPWAACLNLMDAHTPYEVREEHDRWRNALSRDAHDQLPIKWEYGVYGGTIPPAVGKLLEPLYDGAVRGADAALGRALDGLAARDALDDTLVVVTADHGDGLGEPGNTPSEPPAVMHGMGTQEELLHVPLVAKAPGQRAGETVTDLAALTRFPDAVLAAVDGGRHDDGWFTAPDGRTTAYQSPPTGQAAALVREHATDPDRFLEPAAVVYADGPGDSVHKRATWNGEAYDATVRGTTPGHAEDTPLEVDPLAYCERVAADSESLAVTPLDDGDGDMAEYEVEGFDDVDVAERLESLGYL